MIRLGGNMDKYSAIIATLEIEKALLRMKYTILRRYIAYHFKDQRQIVTLKVLNMELESKNLGELEVIHKKYIGY